MKEQEDSNLTRERRLARLLAARLSLTPPVDIQGLLTGFADLAAEETPVGVDAVLLYPDVSRMRPLVIANPRVASTRFRFTLAHELAHIVIPWHVGELAYGYRDPSATTPIADLMTSQMELEANAFASELLMPGPWVANILKLASTFAEGVTRVASGAQASTEAAFYSCVRYAPSARASVLVDASDMVVSVFKTIGALYTMPDMGKTLPPGFGRTAASHLREEFAVGDKRCVTCQVECHRPLPVPKIRIESKTALDRIITDRVEASNRKDIKSSVSGITASLNRDQPSAERLYMDLFTRFSNDQRWSRLMDDQRFDEYLGARATELFEKRLKK